MPIVMKDSCVSFYKYIFVTIFYVLGGFASKADVFGPLEFNGNSFKIIQETPATSTGLDAVYVAYDLSGLSINYTSGSSSPVEWLKYSNMGGGYAEPVVNIEYSGNLSTLLSPEPDMGYIIKEGDRSYYFWLIDYSRHRFSAVSLSEASDQACGETVLNFQGEAPPIHYYTINGRQETLGRGITVNYTTLEWDSERKFYTDKRETKELAYCNNEIVLSPPNYCSTTFILEGDKFLKTWKESQTVETPVITPFSTAVETEAVQEDRNQEDEEREPSNQINNGNEGLGGSAPSTIQFISYVTDAVVHYEWQISTDEEFENIEYRITEQDLSYTFTEEGVKYVRFIGSNFNGSCESYGEVYTVSIGASELLIPNAFSPNEDGVNDVWKVSYRSILEFKCWIFDRHGHQIYHFEDPEGGWDGKRNGRYVKPGVYYYVIQAKGSDGKEYKRSGDINILKSYVSGSGSSGGEGTEIE